MILLELLVIFRCPILAAIAGLTGFLVGYLLQGQFG